ncbi:MAG: hypothetical protein J2P35_01285 [Actinobacteria bacterium]|nr:hypothetical protein [Actinomycetota bacterium]MBO0784798.1 hypothetical protein [Actinomycetota bacterium]
MITEQQLVGLLQRADWTTLSLTAGVSRRFNRALRDEQLRSMPPPPWLPPWARVMMDPDGMPGALGDQLTGRLIVAPGCRFRAELTGPDGDTTTSGCDGERLWLVDPRLRGTETIAGDRHGEGWRGYAGGSPEPPFRQLLSPSWLLTGFVLDIEEAVTVAAREGWHVVAVPRERPLASLQPQRHDLTVDAELGILLRCESFVRGLPLLLEELDAVQIQTAGESQFSVPPDALAGVKDFAGEHVPRGFRTAAGLAADALGFAIRHGPGGPRPTAGGGEPMPHDAGDAGQEDWPPVGDQVAYLLFHARSAERDVAAELSEWDSAEGFAEGLRRGGRVLGQGGMARLADAISDKAAPAATHRLARLIHAAGGVRYRLDWVAGAPRGKPVTESCDGQTRWRVYPDRTLTGPARPAPPRVADLMDPSWLLEWRLADGGEEIVSGRRGYRVRGTRIPGVTLSGPSLIYDAAVAVIDAELGVITRLTSYAAGRPAQRWELRDLRIPAPADLAGQFRIRTPPGGRVEQESGPFDEAPEPLRQAVQTAQQIGRVVGPVVSKAAGFLGSLRSRGRP